MQEELNYLKKKKGDIQNLIQTLNEKIGFESKSYRHLSSQLQAELVKALVSAHDLEIRISNSLLKSYEQLAKLIQTQTSTDISGDLIQEILKTMENLTDKDWNLIKEYNPINVR